MIFMGKVTHQRTKVYLKQIIGSIIFKGAAVMASLTTLPLTINYLGQEQFGVWSTLLSIMSWVVLFDLGIGNGLRNKVTEYLAKNLESEVVDFISLSYMMLGMVIIIFAITASIITFFISWQDVFNTTLITEAVLRVTVLTVTLLVLANFWIGLIGALLGGVQKTSLITAGQAMSSILILIFVWCLYQFSTIPSSILYLAWGYGISLIISNVILSIWFFKRYPKLLPKIKFKKFSNKNILFIGMDFFIIQLAILVLFSTDKFIITQFYGPEYVTNYEVVFKLFSLISLLHSIVLMPLWSSYSDAYHRNDFRWIRSTVIKQFYIYLILVVGVLLLMFISRDIISLWIGSNFAYDYIMVISMGLFVIVLGWTNIFTYLLFGVQKIKISVFTSTLAMIINIPISIFLIKNSSLGVSSVIVGTTIAILPAVFISPIQAFKVINKVDAGLWAK